MTQSCADSRGSPINWHRLVLLGSLASATLTSFVCKAPIDWSEPTVENVMASVRTDSIAGEKYAAWLGVNGEQRAADMMMEWLRGQQGVAEVGQSENGDVWVNHSNGITIGIMLSWRSDTASRPDRPSSDLSKGTAVKQQGLVQWFFGLHAPLDLVKSSNAVAEALARLPGLNGITPWRYPTTVGALRDDRLRLDGLYFLETHCSVSLDKRDTALCFGEMVTPETYEAYLVHLVLHDVIIMENPRSHVAYFGVSPGFFRRFSPQLSAAPTQYYGSLVYIASCYGASFCKTFNIPGVKALFGYQNEPSDPFAVEVDSKFFACLADTYTVGEAFAAVRDKTEVNHGQIARLIASDGNDNDLMLYPYLALQIDGAPLTRCGVCTLWGFMEGGLCAVGVPTDRENTFVQLVCPSATGRYQVGENGIPGAALKYTDKTSRIFLASTFWIGTSGEIEVTRCDGPGKLAEFKFSGVLGYWGSGHNPLHDPPDATVTFSNGFGKSIVASGGK